MSLVSDENFSEILWWLGPRPGNMSQNGQKTTLRMTSLTKNPQLPTKNFFSSADYKTCWIFQGFEQLCSGIGGGAVTLVRQPKTAAFRPKSEYEYIVPRLSRC